MKRYFYLLLICGSCFIDVPTSAWRQHGTVIIAVLSQDRAVLAADSRTIEDGPDGMHKDDGYCKVSTLEDKIAYALFGTTRIQSSPMASSWRAHDEVRRAFHAVQPRCNGVLAGCVATEWAEMVSRGFSEDFRNHPQFSRMFKDGFIVGGLFIGLNADGNLVLFRSLVLVDKTMPGAPKAIPQRDQPLPLVERKISFRPEGQRAIFDEFNDGKTARAAQWKEQFDIEWGRIDPSERAAFIAIRLVDLTIAFAPESAGVGGPVDAVEFHKEKGIRWIQRKPNCGPQHH